MSKLPNRVIAIDWSGAVSGFTKKIWLAEVGAEGLVDLRDGWSRERIGSYLEGVKGNDPNLIVGLDFAFSFPSWFIREEGCTTISELWQHAANKGEEWLGSAEENSSYFFKKGSWGHEDKSRFRLTEQRLQNQKKTPETIFRLVGQRQVGPGSVRGMPILENLRRAGFNIWPFDPPEPPLVVEIYPALFCDKGVKSDLGKRLHLVKDDPRFDELQRTQASCSDDAFDAAISALAMYDRREELLALPPLEELHRLGDENEITSDQVQLEGWIFGS